MANLEAQLQQDLEALKKAFPGLQEQFPDGKWIAWARELDTGVIIFRDDENVGSSCARILQVLVELTDGGAIYSITLPSGTYREFSTLAAAIEFVGRMSKGLTPHP